MRAKEYRYTAVFEPAEGRGIEPAVPRGIVVRSPRL